MQPYNFYVLYLSIAAVVVCLILLLIKVLALFKALKPLSETANSISEKAVKVQIRTSVIQETMNSVQKTLKPLTILLPLMLAIQKEYRNDDALQGIKGYQDAADHVFTKKAKKGQLNAILQSLK